MTKCSKCKKEFHDDEVVRYRRYDGERLGIVHYCIKCDDERLERLPRTYIDSSGLPEPEVADE